MYDRAKVLRSWGRMSTLIIDSENIRKRLDDISDLDSEQVQILESFEKYLLNKD